MKKKKLKLKKYILIHIFNFLSALFLLTILGIYIGRFLFYVKR